MLNLCTGKSRQICRILHHSEGTRVGGASRVAKQIPHRACGPVRNDIQEGEQLPQKQATFELLALT
jgi:hypothetical protein